MSYFSEKCKHAYKCYKKGVPRRKVYVVVEKADKFVVLKQPKSKYIYSLAGGGIEEGEDVVSACKRECLEELNMNVDYVKTLGVIKDKSRWEYKGKSFYVDDDMQIVYAKFISFGSNPSLGLEGEFNAQTSVEEISKEHMLQNVAEFVLYGIKL